MKRFIENHRSLPSYLALLTFCLLFLPSYGQYQKQYGTTFDEILFDALEMPGGDILVSGTTLGANCGGSDILLMRLNGDGNIVWQKSYGDGSFEDYGSALLPAGDGNYVVAGNIEHTQSFGFEDFSLVKFDPNGNLLWTQIYGGNSFEDAQDVCPANNGGFVLAGSTNSFGAGSSDCYVVKTNSSGDVVWSKTFGGSGSDRAWGVTESGDGGYVFCGISTSFGSSFNPYVVKVNSNGNLVWDIKFLTPEGGSAEDIVRTSDGGFALTGNSYADEDGIFIMKLTSSGATSWIRTYASESGFGDVGLEIRELSNGDLAVTGSTGEGPEFANGLFLRTDATGNVQLAGAYAPASGANAFRGMAILSGGGFAFAGTANGSGFSNSDAFVVEIDANGNSGCNEALINLDVNPRTWGRINPATQVANHGNGNKVTASDCNISLTESLICPVGCDSGVTYCYDNLIITGNTTWTTTTSHGSCGPTADVYVSGTITVIPGARLTISPGVTVHFGDEGKVVLENGTSPLQRGAQMLVDGATLTNAGNCQWIGIDVWGKQDESQFPINNTRAAVLRVRNNSLIENAKEAVRLWKPGDLSLSGGVIQASNSTFRNNWRSAEFMSYQNFLPIGSNPPINNASSYRQVTFETTGPLVGGQDPLTHVSQWDVTGVDFTACTFRNTTAGDPTTAGRGVGITSIDARYRVSGLCNGPTFPCTSYINSEFSGLNTGIDAKATNPVRTIFISRTDFLNNDRGALLEGMDYASITYCDFDVDQGTFGLSLNSVSDFKIEENDFLNSGSAGTNVGLIVSNSEDGPNRVYRNTFDNLFAGALPINANDGPGTFDGLQLLCNDFSNCEFDIAVIALLNDQAFNIGFFQGFCNNDQTAANNTFSNTCSGPNNDFFILKAHPQEVIYCHLDGTEPVCPDVNFLITSNCGPETPGGIVPCPEPCLSPDCFKEQLAELTEKGKEFRNLINGGDKGNLLNGISFQSGSAAYALLDGASPYLTDDVLIAAINDGSQPMNESQLVDILMQNSPLSQDVMDAVNAKTPPLSFRAASDLAKAQSGISPITNLEASIAGTENARKAALNGLVIEWLYDDSTGGGLDSALALLVNETDIASRRNVVALHREKGDLGAAKSALNQLLLDDPTGLDYIALNEVLLELDDHPYGILALGENPAMTQTIMDLTAVEQENQVWRQAYLLREVSFGDNYTFEFPLPDNKSAKYARPEPISSDLNEADYQFYPNPAQNLLHFQGEGFQEGNTRISLYNSMGRLILSTTVQAAEAPALDISSLAEGLYILKMEGLTGQSKTAKLLITR